MKNQWKGFTLGIVFILLVVSMIGTSFAAYKTQATLEYDDIKIVIDGETVTPKDVNGNTVEPFIIDGTTYLPVRAIANALGMDVAWDNSTKTATLTTESYVEPVDPSSMTMGQQNALESAKSYLEVLPFSRVGLIDQLEYEGYSTEDATFAVDNCGADWYEQAAKCAQSYLDVMAFSRQGLIDQLLYEGFTQQQAEYGVTSAGY